MKIKSSFALAVAGLVFVSTLHAAEFAASVVNYNSGTGISPGYTNPTVALGTPSIADAYGDAVDPFDPAYATNQIVALGTNGFLTVKFAQPIVSGVPGNPFGLDFLIFGNSFFNVTNAVDSNYNYIGTPATDGSVYSDFCQANVSVSSDGVTFYKLNPALVPKFNYLYPTDGEGNFNLPVNPALTTTNFAGLTMAKIRALYQGSAGGAGYKISWAQDTNGNSVSLFEISYVRVNVQSGQALLAGFASVANPNQVIVEDFSHNPALDGWQASGDIGLFAWNSSASNLSVTWDATQVNSYYYHPLGTILATNDNFYLGFDLLLTDYASGPASQKLYTFQLAAGLQNHGQAIQPGFVRGSGSASPNLAEFNFFPNDGLGDQTVMPAMFDTNSYLSNPLELSDGDYAPINLPTGVVMRVTLSYTASNELTVLNVTTNGGTVCQVIPDTPFRSGFTDFRLDTFAVASYSAAGSGGGSLLAHGTIGNVMLVVPPPPVGLLQPTFGAGSKQVQFSGLTLWNYMLQSSTNLQTWAAAGPLVAGTNGPMTLQVTNTAQAHQFYRVIAQKN